MFMRLTKSLLFALMLCACSAWAEWVKMTESDGTAFFMDPTTISQDGDLRRVGTLTNLKQRDKYGAMSLRITHEYDCKLDKVRMPSFSYHADHMAKGETLLSNSTPAPWNDVPPDTVLMAVRKIVCAH